jgi:hypothetical protein
MDIKLTRLLISFSLSGADLAVALKQTTLVLAKLASSKITRHSSDSKRHFNNFLDK